MNMVRTMPEETEIRITQPDGTITNGRGIVIPPKEPILSVLKRKLTEEEQLTLMEDMNLELNIGLESYRNEMQTLRNEMSRFVKAPTMWLNWMEKGFFYGKSDEYSGTFILKKVKLAIKSFRLGMYVNTLPEELQKTITCYLAVEVENGFTNEYRLFKKDGTSLHTFHSTGNICLGDLKDVKHLEVSLITPDKLDGIFRKIVELLEVVNPHSWMTSSLDSSLAAMFDYIDIKKAEYDNQTRTIERCSCCNDLYDENGDAHCACAFCDSCSMCFEHNGSCDDDCGCADCVHSENCDCPDCREGR